jgi:site-specific recombinase XerC
VLTGQVFADPGVDLQQVTVSVNDQNVIAYDATGRFFTLVDVLPGRNEYIVRASDGQSNILSQVFTTIGITETSTLPPGYVDVTASFQGVHRLTSSSRGGRTVNVTLASKNRGEFEVGVPLLIGVKNISEPTIHLMSTDGSLPDGTLYYDFTRLAAGGKLAPNQETTPKAISFHNPNLTTFSYDLVFYGKLNSAPTFDSIPIVYGTLGKEYVYQSHAVDKDQDSIKYELAIYPTGMMIDPSSGLIQWQPTSEQLGSHDVAIRALDHFGGVTEQRFSLSITAPAANRPPIIVSTPVLATNIGSDLYKYAVQAFDPDRDPLTYSLSAAPTGMSIDSTSGLILWSPSALQMGNHETSVQVSDGLGGIVAQTFVVCVLPDSTNHMPFIVSHPPGLEGASFQYGVQAIDADNDSLTYSLVEAPPGMTIDAKSGQINWTVGHQNILSNASFESVPSPPTQGPGQVPSDWVAVASISPAADTWSTDGSYGINTTSPGSYMGNWPVETPAHSGVRWIAGARFGAAGAYEGIGQLLPDPLLPGHIYQATAAIMASQLTTTINSVGYEVWLADGASIASNAIKVGQFSSATINAQWEDRKFQFLAPEGLPFSFNYFVLIPYATHPSELAYVAIDDVSIASVESPTVSVRVEDGRGGFDEQSFTIAIVNGSGEIHGTKFNDVSGDGIRFFNDFASFAVNSSTDIIADFEQEPQSGIEIYSPVTLGAMTITAYGGVPSPNLFIYTPAIQAVRQFRDFGVTLTSNVLTATGDEVFEFSFAQPPTAVGFNTITNFSTSKPILTVFDINESLLGTYTLNQPADTFGFVGITANAPIGKIRWTGFEGGIKDTGIDNIRTGLVLPEPGLANWTIYLDQNQNGRRDPGERFTVTDSQGNYAFTGIPSGTFYVAEEPRSGWRQTLPGNAIHTVVVTDNQVVSSVNFGNTQVATISNQAPRFFSTAPTEAVAGDAITYVTNVQDPDNDPVTFDLPVSPAGMTIHPTLGIVAWQPTLAQLGSQAIIIRAKDNHGGVTLQSFAINVVPPNTPPTVLSVPPVRAVVDHPFVYQLRVSDANDDVLTFTGVTLPIGANLDGATGLFTWTPVANQVGQQSFAITVSDGRGGETLQEFTINVLTTATNTSPVITSTPPSAVFQPLGFYYAITAADSDGDPLMFALEEMPAGMSLASNGVLRWQPSPAQLGEYDVTVFVTDGQGGEARQSFMLHVGLIDQNHAPRIISNPPHSVALGKTLTYNAVAVDEDQDVLAWSLEAAPVGMSVDAVTGQLRWQPRADQLGNYEVILRVEDPLLGIARQRFSISACCHNFPPIIISVPVTQGVATRSYLYPVRATDADGDSVQFSLDVAPTGMTIDATTGVIRWNPTSAGATSVVVRAADSSGDFGIQSYTLQVGLPTDPSIPGDPNSPPLAIRMCLDWLVIGQIIPMNPAASVRGPSYVTKRGKTPVLTAEEARQLLDSIDLATVVGLRDRALIGVMVYSFARVGAVVGMTVQDYYQNGKRSWLRLHEKGGKFHEVPAHHNAEAYLDAYLADSGLGDTKSTPLFRTAAGKSGKLTGNPMTRHDVLRMIKRRAKACGLNPHICCHTFRATGITAYLENGGTIEKAQLIAAHESPRTTKLYDRTDDSITLDEVEKIHI